jgi:tetratricopeptide (TPR) repeat protein
VLRIINAVDRCLRRVLRDDPAARVEIRLKALAPDEIRIDAVLAELRRNERIPMELAAGIHELFETGRRLENGAEVTSGDRARAVLVADTLRARLDRLPATPPRAGGSAPAAEARVRLSAPAPSAPGRVSPVRSVPAPGVSREDAAPVPDGMEGEPAQQRRLRVGPPPGRVVALVALAGVLIWFVLSFMGGGESQDLDQARTLFENGQLTEASMLFQKYAEENPKDVTPHLFLARIHRRLQEPELAAEAIREAERISPDDAAVHRELGFLLLDTGQPDVAVSRFNTAIARDSASMEAWVGLARALRESGRREEIAAAIATAPAEVRAVLTPDSF